MTNLEQSLPLIDRTEIPEGDSGDGETEMNTYTLLT